MGLGWRAQAGRSWVQKGGQSRGGDRGLATLLPRRRNVLLLYPEAASRLVTPAAPSTASSRPWLFFSSLPVRVCARVHGVWGAVRVPPPVGFGACCRGRGCCHIRRRSRTRQRPTAAGARPPRPCAGRSQVAGRVHVVPDAREQRVAAACRAQAPRAALDAHVLQEHLGKRVRGAGTCQAAWRGGGNGGTAVCRFLFHR